ncbi:MAG: pseudouridine synthase [Chloroflexota bacterium]
MAQHVGDSANEGVRLQKIMAQAGVGSRRRCEELISAGRVKVNGVVVRELGARARVGVDTVEVDGVDIGAGERIVRYAVYKPRGYVSTASDPEGRPKVTDLVPSTLRLYPVGRLDYDSEGLIIVTNDGHLTNILTHPSHQIGKTYLALVKGTPDAQALSTLRRGVTLEDGVTAPARVRLIKPEGDDTWIELTIHEGRNRQVRRMCEAVGHPVSRLIRTRIAFLTLAGLQPGKFRALSDEEVARLEAEADPQRLDAEAETDDGRAPAGRRDDRKVTSRSDAAPRSKTVRKPVPGLPARPPVRSRPTPARGRPRAADKLGTASRPVPAGTRGGSGRRDFGKGGGRGRGH